MMVRRLLPAAVLVWTLLVAGAAAAADAPAPTPGTVFRDCPECPEMVVVPAGTFVMGSVTGYRHALPPHRVTVAEPFAIGRFEVTFDEWRACVDDGGCVRMPDDHRWGRGRRPVINLEYHEIRDYTGWLSARTGHTYRLPSEAEWEYAARAGTRSPYWWGETVGDGRANCRDCGSQWSGHESAPVGSFEANPFGLFDTAGNVWEWVRDCWNPTYLGAPADTAPRLEGRCEARVIRGGSWYYFPRLSQSGYRYFNDKRVKSYNIGFRVVRELP